MLLGIKLITEEVECQKIAESSSEYQFEDKEALKENDPETNKFDSYGDEESPSMADEIDYIAVFLVGRASRFGRAITISNKLLSQIQW